MRRLLTAALGLGLLALAGCSGDADPAPAPASPSSTTASPSPSPSPTAPVMPEAARAHTEAGAKAFVEYFWEVVNYAEVTGDVEALTPTFEEGCEACKAGVAGIATVYRGGGRIAGGSGTVKVRKVDLSYGGPFRFADVTLELQTDEQIVDYPGTARDQKRPAAVVHDLFKLSARDEETWKVAQFEAVK